jgi:hypothetical protein
MVEQAAVNRETQVQFLAEAILHCGVVGNTPDFEFGITCSNQVSVIKAM